jgi:peptide/nickel transport system ATP-binding protein
VTEVLEHAASAPSVGSEVLVELQDLVVDYGSVRAVDHVSLKIRAGEIVGLAGESGCGKSTTGNAIMQILRPPAKVTSGRILFRGEDLIGKNTEELRQFRWRNVSMVFQSAMNALNPVMRVGNQFVDMMQAHERIDRGTALARSGELLERVGIDRRRVRSYPHELSGGMRQRVVIAMALALSPEIVIMDEPTTALDVVTQREILEELMELRDRLGFAVLFITHDLSLLIEIADSIAVMYAGRLVERAEATALFRAPRHPYSLGLLRSFPGLHGPRQHLTGIPGSPPDLRRLPAGCVFHPRCSYAMDRCRTDAPALLPPAGEDGRLAACWLQQGAAPAPAELAVPAPGADLAAAPTVRTQP